jgi:ATP-dependent DNA ligase
MLLQVDRPLKASSKPITDLATLQHLLPLYASDKEDGIRCLIHPKLGPISQTFKPILNDYVRETLAEYCPTGLDGELIVPGKDFNDIQSAIMTKTGIPDWKYLVFDCFTNIYDPFVTRFSRAGTLIQELNNEYPSEDPAIKLLPQILCTTIKEIENAEAYALARGKEGIMLRVPGGYYKEGRSSLNEGYLLKVKRFMDDEAVVIDIEEQIENCNPAKRGYDNCLRRSTHAAFMKPTGLMGKIICKWKGHRIKIGSGFTEEQRARYWNNPSFIVGKTITFTYQPHGMRTLPRAPIFKGIRYD